jgi:hypothetical protein
VRHVATRSADRFSEAADVTRWLIAALLTLAACFAASYLVPLDESGQAAFERLLRWLWPGTGDGQLRLVGFFIALSSAGLLVLTALAVLTLRVSIGWRRTAALVGAALSLSLMVLFFSLAKLLPIGIDLAVAWLAVSDRFELDR